MTARLPLASIRSGVLILAAWAAVALALSLEGYLTSHNAGRPQAWWPSFGYSLAIFSVWAAMT